jgi:hypothetical protein
MAKKIRVLNSPWGREFERPSDCERWIQQGHAAMTPEGLIFSDAFLRGQLRQAVEFDPTGTDDGVLRRWVTRDMAMQLLPVSLVGTGNSVTRHPDKLDHPRSVNFKKSWRLRQYRLSPV